MAFVGFQSNAFQVPRIVQAAIDVIKGGFDHGNYRKELKKAIRAAEKYGASKYVKQAQKVAKIVADKGIESPIIERVAVSAQEKNTIIGVAAYVAELKRVLALMETMEARLTKQQELEDEMVVLMLL